MKFPTGSNKAVARLSARSLKANKTRNIVAIIAIALTAILFTSVFTIGMGLKQSMEESTFRMVGGYAHGVFKDLTEEQYAKIATHPLIKEKGRTRVIGFPENKALLKHHTEIRYADDNTAKWMYIDVQEGRAPESIDEVAMDTMVLDLLGLPHELGIKVPLVFKIGETTIEKELILTGYWERLEGISVSQIRVSEAFVEECEQYLLEGKINNLMGTVTMDIMLDNAFNIERKINQIATESGFIPDGEGEKGVNVGVNWAYMGAEDKTIEPMALIGVIGSILLIMFTGYLIIYNVFHISVMTDIRFYGLLKTIGTTPKQIKGMVRRQAFYLSIIGIPIGLLIGYSLGNGLLPIIMQTTNVNITKLSASPIIFIGSALFALITVFVSCRKPTKMATRITPIEASKYSEVTMSKTVERKAKKNTAIHMAYRNIARNKKKSIIVVASLSLSIVLLNSVYTYTEGFNLDKYLSKRVVSDFILANTNYFNIMKHFRGEEDVPSRQYIEMISNLEGVKEVDAIYYDTNPLRESSSQRIVQLYGIQKGLLSKLEVIEGEIDLEKWLTEDYAFEVVWTDDYGNIDWTSSDYAIGQQVEIESETPGQGKKAYKIIAKVVMPHNMGVRYSSWDENGRAKELIISDTIFKSYVLQPLVMAYHVQVEEGAATSIEAIIENYTTQVEPTMDYESKQYFVDDFKGIKDMFFTVGLVASMIIGMIGIINFINVLFTSILSRRGEFAILQSIGMTTKQLKRILILEGLLYAVITAGVVIVLSIVTSYFLVKPLCQGMWFCTYQFKFMPVMLAIPCMLGLGAIVPAFIQKILGKETIVERLRKIN